MKSLKKDYIKINGRLMKHKHWLWNYIKMLIILRNNIDYIKTMEHIRPKYIIFDSIEAGIA